MDSDENKDYKKEEKNKIKVALMGIDNENYSSHLIYLQNPGKQFLISKKIESKKSLAELIKDIKPPFEIQIKRFDEKGEK